MKKPTKENLIKELIKDGYLKTPSIIETFNAIDRKDFVREETINEAYENYPLAIGFGQTISQPLTVAFMLELLTPKTGEKILDIGAGSGWQTTLLAYVVGKSQINADNVQIDAEKDLRESTLGNLRKSAIVVAIERIPELRKFAEENISKYENLKNNIKIILGDGAKGFEEEAPYDKIIAAAAGEEIPAAWKEQLKIGGRIVAPVRQSIIVLDKTGQNQFSQKQYFGFNFVPLITE